MSDSILIGERTIFNNTPEFEIELEDLRVSIETQIQEFEQKYNCFFVFKKSNHLIAVVNIHPTH